MHRFLLVAVCLVALVFGAVSCADEDLGPVLTYDIAGKGAYIRLVEESDKLINLFDIPGSKYTYSVEFRDEQQGNLVSEYLIELTYSDADLSDGDQSTGPLTFRTYMPSDFEDVNGYKGMTDIVVTADEAIAAAGLTPDKVNPGDQFTFNGYVILEDGSRFGYENSSAAVRGSAFQGHFRYTLPAGCPSDLAGTFSFTGSDYWCDGGSSTGEIEIISRGGGVYTFDDWSLGAYPSCYGGLAASWGELEFTEVCAEVSFTGSTDNYGDTWTFTSEVNGTEWSIEWVNTYGESGKAVITNPNGWGFVIVD